MEFAIFNIFVLLVIVVWQRAQFRRAIKQKNNEIARIKDINHELAEKLIDARRQRHMVYFSETMKNGAIGQ